MKTENLCGGVAIACTLMSAAAPAQTLSQPSDSKALLAHFENVSEGDLKTQYLLCARASSQRLLSLGEAIGCSTTGEVLKARSFGGDFNALLAWWRLHRDEGEPADGETQ